MSGTVGVWRPERGGDRGVDPDPCVGTAGKRKAGEAHLGRLDLTGYRYGFRQVRGPRRAMGRSHQYGSSIKTTSLPNACQTLRKGGGGPPFSKRGAAPLLRISSDPPDPARISAPSRQSNASHHARPHRAQRGRARKAFKAHRSRRRRSFEQTQARVATYQHMDGRL